MQELEAQFMISKIKYNMGDYDGAESNIFTLVSDFSSYDEWKFKGFLLLVRTYIGFERPFPSQSNSREHHGKRKR